VEGLTVVQYCFSLARSLS